MRDRTARIAGPAGFALFAALGIAMSPRSVETAAAAAAAGTAIAVLVAWRGWTGWPLVLGLVPVAALLVVEGHGEAACLSWMGLCILAGWVALSSEPATSVAAGLGLVAVPVTEWFAQTEEPGWAAWCIGTSFTVVSCMFAARLRTTVEQLRAAQHELAERTRAEERNRIAAEMHDVIGHALTVSLLHIGSARLSLDDDPEEARASLAEAERLAQQSLAEVRATVGMMRTPGGSHVAPLPGAADVAELVESYRRAGTPVTLEVVGDLADVNATRGLAAYRIVQESLTNAARHAPGAEARVVIEVTADGTTVTVTTGGTPRVGAAEGAGLVGMRERAEALGGRLLAGPTGAGWRVEAVLPS